eukprot:Hpha_TRINITY_DN16074_c1_g2::TRINITY_DN16074_c1_g2_i3::g.119567::m.119567
MWAEVVERLRVSSEWRWGGGEGRWAKESGSAEAASVTQARVERMSAEVVERLRVSSEWQWGGGERDADAADRDRDPYGDRLAHVDRDGDALIDKVGDDLVDSAGGDEVANAALRNSDRHEESQSVLFIHPANNNTQCQRNSHCQRHPDAEPVTHGKPHAHQHNADRVRHRHLDGIDDAFLTNSAAHADNDGEPHALRDPP